MLSSYIPFCLVFCFLGAVVLHVYIPWWMWIFAAAADAYTINETRQWRRAARRNREMQEEVDRLTRDVSATKEER
jgi:Flp pilus assembly protein TadB